MSRQRLVAVSADKDCDSRAGAAAGWAGQQDEAPELVVGALQTKCAPASKGTGPDVKSDAKAQQLNISIGGGQLPKPR